MESPRDGFGGESPPTSTRNQTSPARRNHTQSPTTTPTRKPELASRALSSVSATSSPTFSDNHQSQPIRSENKENTRRRSQPPSQAQIAPRQKRRRWTGANDDMHGTGVATKTTHNPHIVIETTRKDFVALVQLSRRTLKLLAWLALLSVYILYLIAVTDTSESTLSKSCAGPRVCWFAPAMP